MFTDTTEHKGDTTSTWKGRKIQSDTFPKEKPPSQPHQLLQVLKQKQIHKKKNSTPKPEAWLHEPDETIY